MQKNFMIVSKFSNSLSLHIPIWQGVNYMCLNFIFDILKLQYKICFSNYNHYRYMVNHRHIMILDFAYAKAFLYKF